MPLHDDPRLTEAKALPMSEVIDRLGIAGLRRNGWELSGPCPICGASGHDPKSGPVDRFNINLRTNQWLCRKCPDGGADQVSLVRFVEGCSFPEALTILCGDKPKQETQEQRRARERRQNAAKKKVQQQAKEQERIAARYKARAIKDAKSIWQRAEPMGESAHVSSYLSTRGIVLGAEPKCLRFLPDHPYVKKISGELVTLYRGPCMIAAIQGPDRTLTAVHQTWLQHEAPYRKAVITYQDEGYPSKMVRGSKKGGAIRLYTPKDATTLVMGEGIETTLSAMIAAPVPNAAYWAGVDLGNMSGRMKRQKGIRYSGLPDLQDRDAFVPPAWVKQLVYIMDGDSDPKATRAKLQCGLKRAMALRPGLRGRIVNPGRGVDLNDVLQGKRHALELALSGAQTGDVEGVAP